MFRKIIGIGLLIGLLAFAYVNRSYIKRFLFGNQRTVNQKEVRFLLKTDISIDSLANLLVSEGVLKTKKSFLKEAKEQQLTNQIDAGKYRILSKTHFSQLVDDFKLAEHGHAKGEIKVNVIFNNCQTIADIGSTISKCIEADSTSIVDYILSSNTLKKYDLNQAQIPALFIPDNYEMYFDTDAAAFVSFMKEQYDAYWTNDKLNQLKNIGFSKPYQATTLASIVYSEQSKVEEEWPIIAGLYLNRLKKGIKLQSDPTFRYCWGEKLDGVQRLTYKHRDIDCPYNTYKIDGIPPGPICIVPKEVIDAVLKPDNNDYIFMCAKPNYSGEHNFAVNGIQHNRNANVYRKWLSSEGIR